MIKTVIILFIITGLCHLEAEGFDISLRDIEEGRILNQFFKMGIEEEEYGYVLEGVKPISVRNFYSLDAFPVCSMNETSETEFMKTLLVQSAIPVWDKLCSHQNTFCLKAISITKIEPDVEGEIEVMFINIPKLREVVEENIHLFRYILNPSLNARQIVNKIAYSKESLSDVLNQNLVLTGIVLGFGTHNSLLGGRAEGFFVSSFAKDLPPLTPKSYFIQKKCSPGLDFLSPERFGNYYLDLFGGERNLFCKNSFPPIKINPNFPSVEKELLFLESIKMSLPPCLRTPPAFVFSAFKGDDSNELFFNLLKQTQKRIQKLLKGSSFLTRVLEKIGGKKPHINIDPTLIAQNPRLGRTLNMKQWMHVLSSVASKFKEKNDRERFAYNFCHSHERPPCQKMMFASRATLKGLKLSIQNLAKTDAYFETLFKRASQKEIFQEVYPKKLYFETTLHGHKEAVKGPLSVRINYIVENVGKEVLFADYDAWVPISSSIPGFAHGIQGMRIGEERTIFIHPSFGYGALTTLPPCEPLIIKVHLLEVKKTKNPKDLPPLESLDLSWIQNPSFYKNIQEAVKLKPKCVGSFYREILDKIENLDKKFLIDYICKNFCSDHSHTAKEDF